MKLEVSDNMVSPDHADTLLLKVFPVTVMGREYWLHLGQGVAVGIVSRDGSGFIVGVDLTSVSLLTGESTDATVSDRVGSTIGVKSFVNASCGLEVLRGVEVGPM